MNIFKSFLLLFLKLVLFGLYSKYKNPTITKYMAFQNIIKFNDYKIRHVGGWYLVTQFHSCRDPQITAVSHLVFPQILFGHKLTHNDKTKNTLRITALQRVSQKG